MKQLLLLLCLGIAGTAFSQTTEIEQLEKGIEQNELIIKQRQDSLDKVTARIADLKQELKGLEAQKKALEKDIKANTKERKEKFVARDNQVFEEEVEDVLYNPYNRQDVEDALKSFEGMETKDVIKKKALVENYGEYTANLRAFLEKQKNELAKNNWTYVSSTDDAYKKFEKGLKGTKYWKTYNNREKKGATSIDYLDRVMNRVMQFKNAGLNKEKDLNEIINMLYEQ